MTSFQVLFTRIALFAHSEVVLSIFFYTNSFFCTQMSLLFTLTLFVRREVVASIDYINSFICTLWSCFKSFHVFFTLYLQTVKLFLLLFKVIAFLHAVKLFQVLFPLISLFAHSEVFSSNVYRNSFIYTLWNRFKYCSLLYYILYRVNSF